MERGEHSLESVLLNNSKFLAFFQTENQSFARRHLVGLLPGATLSSSNSEGTFSPSNAFDTGIKGFEHI